MSAPEYDGHEFVMILREGKDATGAPTLEAAGVIRPEPLDLNHPVHRVGHFVAANINAIAAAAMQMGSVPTKEQNPAEPQVITGDRERTIVLPPGARA